MKTEFVAIICQVDLHPLSINVVDLRHPNILSESVRVEKMKLRPMFIRQPGAVESDVLGGIGDGDGFLVDHWQRTRVVGGN